MPSLDDDQEIVNNTSSVNRVPQINPPPIRRPLDNDPASVPVVPPSAAPSRLDDSTVNILQVEASSKPLGGLMEAAATPNADAQVTQVDEASAARSLRNPIYRAVSVLNETMKTVQKTLAEHGVKFDILTKDAIKGRSVLKAVLSRELTAGAR